MSGAAPPFLPTSARPAAAQSWQFRAHYFAGFEVRAMGQKNFLISDNKLSVHVAVKDIYAVLMAWTALYFLLESPQKLNATIKKSRTDYETILCLCDSRSSCMSIAVFWVMALYTFVGRYQQFGERHQLHRSPWRWSRYVHSKPQSKSLPLLQHRISYIVMNVLMGT